MWVDSKIGKWELIREVDSTVVILNGSVIGHTHPTDTAFTEPLPYASISFTRSSDSKYHRVETDSAGNFSIYLEPGYYFRLDIQD